MIFINRAQDIVEKYGKKVIGWDEIQSSKIKPNTIVQCWAVLENAKGAIHKGAKILMSPAPSMPTWICSTIAYRLMVCIGHIT